MASPREVLQASTARSVVERCAGPFAWFLVAAVVVLGHMRIFTTVSQIDELSHFDYVAQVADGNLVRWGDSVGQEALRAEACRGLDRGDALPPCTSEVFAAGDFQDFGQNMSAKAWPIYYAPTAAVALVLRSALSLDSLFVAARITGILWLGIGLNLTARLLCQLGVKKGLRVAIGVLIATTPVVVHASSTVNPDAGLLAIGAATLLLTHSIVTGRRSMWWAAVLPFVSLYDRSAVLVVCACLIWLCAHVFGGGVVTPHEPPKLTASTGRRVLVLACLALMTAAVFSTSSAIRLAAFGDHSDTQVVPTADQQRRQYRPPEISSGHLDAMQVASNLPALVTPVRSPYLPAPMQRVEIAVVVQFLDWLLLLGVGSVLLRPAKGSDRLRVLALGLGLAMCSGPLQVIVTYLQSGNYYFTNSRFGISLLPGLALFLGVVARDRWVKTAVGVLAVSSAAALCAAFIFG